MNIKKLSDVAFIDISGVDKKTNNQEKSVRLCNFTDVYYNWAVSKDNIDSFMVASANDNEINRFLLKKGSVAITKDSETRNDIGMSCYIADDLDNTLLGYHCALIVPNNKVLNGKYLNAFLNSKTARKYFSNQASGSGQRYTLSISGIGAIKIPIIPLYNQEKIGNIFSYIDRKILNNNKINTYLEELAKTIYDYWFLQFEFPNEEGKPYKSSGGKMVYNEQLKREIPEGWEVVNIRDICNVTWGQCPEGENILPLNYDGNDAVLYCSGAGDMRNGLLVDCQAKTNASRRYAYKNDILMSVAGSIGALAICNNKISLGRAAAAFTPKENKLLYSYLTISMFVNRMKNISSGSIQKVVSDKHLDDMNFPYCEAISEKFAIFNNLINMQIKREQENQELSSLRDFLLPLLMNGQVTFKEENEKLDSESKQVITIPYLDGFNQWKQMQGYALRGNADEEILKQIYDAMDEDDKK